MVTFDSQAMASAYVAKLNLDWPMLLDSEKELYAKYGMPRAGWWALSNPIVVWKYILLILRGFTPGKIGKDIKQLGGNVLIDPTGIIRMNHVSGDPHDRPAIEEIFAIADAGK
ncbi:MAG: hypothetical protein ACI87E_001648 [Mariniblastus sp.]